MKNELQKHTLNLFAGDYEKIQSLFPDLGAAVIIRKVIRSFIERTEAGADETPIITDVRI